MFNHLKFDIMEKEVKIQIPEGYEIDREQSTFERIVLKKKGLTYENVARKLFSDKGAFYTTDSGGIVHGRYSARTRFADPNNATNEKQLEQILALNKLMNVARYLNGDWEPQSGDDKFSLYCDTIKRKITVDVEFLITRTTAYFKSADLAYQAIEILGEAEVKKAFGIFE
jgi:hypothetical protein